MADSTMHLTREQGKILLKLARQTLEERLGTPPGRREDEVLAAALRDPAFQENRGTFVCLKHDGQLRGCIGSLVGDVSIAEGVRRNAANAAFQDPRFPSLSSGELDHIQLEVSVLTPPRPLDYQDGADLIAKLRPHVDGVIIRRGLASATFLPQVWEQLPQAEAFLTHLCSKAGLPPHIWRDSLLEVLIYEVQAFSEKEVRD